MSKTWKLKNFKLPLALVDQLEQEAKRQMRTEITLVKIALREYFERLEAREAQYYHMRETLPGSQLDVPPIQRPGKPKDRQGGANSR